MVGCIRRLRRLTALKLALAFVLAAVTLALQPGGSARADQATCVFPFTPTAYEDLEDRGLFLDTIELAAFDMLFPGDPYFGLPEISWGPRDNRQLMPAKVPPVLLKAIAYVESSITQTGTRVPFGSIGPALVAFDCGHGVTQVTSGMTIPRGENGKGSPEQALVATHFAYNIARGAHILVEKWNEAPENRPIAGSNTNGHPALLENWYFAVWGYNGFTGPGANRSNHPMDPIYGSWPRTPYSCGPSNDGLGHNRSNYPYQELVLGCAANPPHINGGPLWEPQPISLPDLNHPFWGGPLHLDNFVFPYARMDIPSPQPFNLDFTERPNPSRRAEILGEPRLAIDTDTVFVAFLREFGATSGVIEVSNSGTGVLAYYAHASAPWLTITPYTGVAIGEDVTCLEDEYCERVDRMRISVDKDRVPPGTTQVQVVVQALGSPQFAVINVEVFEITRLALGQN